MTAVAIASTTHTCFSPHLYLPPVCLSSSQDVHIIMELCEGGELFDRIVERKHYTERQAARVIRQVVEVLDFCHQKGLVHRDLKPENTLLVSKRSDTRVKVIDFGMAIYLKQGERREQWGWRPRCRAQPLCATT